MRLSAPLVSALLVAALLLNKALSPLPGVSPRAYHDELWRAIQSVPRSIGAWTGTDDEPAVPALFRANAVLCRRYDASRAGRTVTMTIVHGRDVHDMLGCSAPLYYAAAGWSELRAIARSWDLGALRARGMEYRFSREDGEELSEIVVDDFFVLPGGESVRDTAALLRDAREVRSAVGGAVQVQIVTDGTLPAVERDRILTTFLAALETVLERVVSPFRLYPGKTSAPED